MYNHAEPGEGATLARLAARTVAYHAQARIEDADSLRRFRAAWEPVDPAQKLLSGLPNCPFLGFLDDPTALEPGRRARVGCMVHPLQNDGIDGRDCGVYDRKVCDEYLCAAHDLLSRDERWLVLQAVDDSYLYGLVITNVRLVKELFEQAARINGAFPDRGTLARPGVVAAAARFFELMRDWPYAARDGVFGQIVAGQDLETSRRAGPSVTLGVEPERFEAILTCLGTEVDSIEALEAARSRVCEAVESFASALSISPSSGARE